jgi:3-oxoacyl-[acyl-carrier protein] reductase
MDLGLHGKVAIVCAASQGLGKAVALGLAREGAHTVVCSRNRRRITQAAREIASDPGVSSSVVPMVADLTRAGDVRKLVERTVKRFGRVDILVTNAGGPPVAAFLELDDRTWERGVRLTLLSAVRCIRAVLPHMRQHKWGRIINITSIAAREPIDDLVISSTLRPGILGMTKVLANRHAHEGITVNSVAPGFILTARQEEIAKARGKAQHQSPAQYLRGVARGIPAGRLGTPDELAHVIVFLASERASYVNGTTVSVDGGLSRGLF